MTPVGQSAFDRVGGSLVTGTTENWSALTCVLLWPGLSFTALFRTDRSCCGGRRTTQIVPCFLALMVLLVSAVAALPCHAAEGSDSKSVGRISRDTTMASPEANALHSEAEKLLAGGSEASVRKAITKYAELESFAKTRQSRAIEGVALQGMGWAYGMIGKYSTAIRYFQRAVALFDAVGDREEKGITLERLGDSYSDVGATDQALQRYQQALAVYGSIPLADGESTVLVRIGNIYYRWGEFPRAIDAYSRALRIDRALDNPRREAMVLGNLANIYQDTGDPRKALESRENALVLGLKYGTESEQVNYLIGIALDYMHLGENQRALSYLQQAEDLAAAIKDSDSEVRVIINRGTIVGNLGSHKEARAHYELAWTKSKSLLKRNLPLESYILQRLASSYERDGDITGAIERYREAFSISDKLRNRQSQADILANVAILEGNRGNKKESLRLLEKALALARESHHLSLEVQTMLELSDLYARLGDESRASDFVRRALVLGQKSQDVALRGSVLSAAMNQSRRQNQTELAIFYGKGAIAAFQQVRTGMVGLPSSLSMHFKESKQKAYHEVAGLLLSVGRTDEAQEILDLLKEREHAEFVRNLPNARPGAAPTLSKGERELEDRFRQVGEQVVALGQERDELLRKHERSNEDVARLRELDPLIESANHGFEKFLAELRNKLLQSPGGAELLPALREARGLRDTLRELGPGVVALRAFLTDDAYYVILITSEVVVPKIVAIKRAEVERQISDLLERVTSPKLDAQQSAARLYQTIVGPVAKELRDARAHTLMWSLDGILRYIPLAALHDGKHYLVEDYRIAIFTPASQSRLERPSKATWRGLGLGYTKGPDPLPNAAAEVRAVVRDVADQGSLAGLLEGKILLDEAFTKEAMLAALEREGPFSVVHVASHFKFRPGGDSESFLVTGGPIKRFTLADMKVAPHLFRGVELVTLSACDTARGEVEADGREIESLAVLTQQQGAASVLATLWPVADISTAKLMRTFYALRIQNPGISKAEALRQAQISLLSGTTPSNLSVDAGSTVSATANSLGSREGQSAVADTRYVHPYFWAPFVLIGNWR